MNDCRYEWMDNSVVPLVVPVVSTHTPFALVAFQPGENRDGTLRRKHKIDNWAYLIKGTLLKGISLIKMITTARRPMTKNTPTDTRLRYPWRKGGEEQDTNSKTEFLRFPNVNVPPLPRKQSLPKSRCQHLPGLRNSLAYVDYAMDASFGGRIFSLGWMKLWYFPEAT